MNSARKSERALSRHQMAMAKNVSHLKTKQAKQLQVHLLCESLKRTIRSK